VFVLRKEKGKMLRKSILGAILTSLLVVAFASCITPVHATGIDSVSSAKGTTVQISDLTIEWLVNDSTNMKANIHAITDRGNYDFLVEGTYEQNGEERSLSLNANLLLTNGSMLDAGSAIASRADILYDAPYACPGTAVNTLKIHLGHLAALAVAVAGIFLVVAVFVYAAYQAYIGDWSGVVKTVQWGILLASIVWCYGTIYWADRNADKSLDLYIPWDSYILSTLSQGMLYIATAFNWWLVAPATFLFITYYTATLVKPRQGLPHPPQLSPSASFAWSPAVVFPCKEVCFVSTSYDPNTCGEIQCWHWWFGDGSEGYGKTIAHVYTQPGEYCVKLEVTDNYGLVNDTSTGIMGMSFFVAPESYIVVRGMDYRIYYRAWNGGWMVLPGATCDSPAATMIGNALHIVVRGMDGNTLWYGCLSNLADPCSFSGWTLLSGATHSAPTLTSNGNVLCLVVRGLDDRIYYRVRDSCGCWENWSTVPTGVTVDSPGAALLGNDLHIIVRGMDGNSLWHTTVSCGCTSSPIWTLMSGATPSKPILAASQSSSELCLVVRGLDNRIWLREYCCSWGDWNALTGATIDGPAATIANNKLCIVVRGIGGNSLWGEYGDLGTSGFSYWTFLSGATQSAPTLAS
jgi:PKD repeat protein